VSDQSDHLFREVDEDLRQERWEKLWRRYGRLALSGAVAIVIATAAFVGWRDYQHGQRQALSERFSSALALAAEEGPAPAADAFALLAQDAGGGYAALARLRQAVFLAEAGDAEGALAIYDGIAADGGAPGPLRDAATVLYGYHGIGLVDGAALAARLEPLVTEDSAWRHSAREILALLDVDAGDVAAARARFEALADDATAPRGVRTRATEMLAALGPA